ncbi:hypothetical protein CIU45_03070 [Salmonella enterica]|nr:hypothetical protein [Salmonella enterica]
MDMKSVLQSSYFFINSEFIVASDPILASHPSGGLREVTSEYQTPPRKIKFNNLLFYMNFN